MQRNEVVSVSELMEALKMVQTKVPQDPVRVHFAQDTDMAGIILHKKTEKAGSRNWIVDSGATNHMCGDACAFHSLTKLPNPIKIHLPDNSVSYATHTGNITLSPTLTLSNVLLIPSFKHNLLSVSQLCQSLSIAFVFLTSSCILQDLTTKRPLAIGTKVGKLYFLDPNSFYVSPQHTCYSAEDCSAHNENFVIWHRRLGHPSLAVLTHVKELDIGAISKDHGQKGYKLFDLDNHVIIISRDVTFHEHIFPYINHSELSPSPMLIPTSVLDHHTDLIQPVLPPAPISDPIPPPPTLPITQIPDSDPPLRRSQRHIKTPTWLTDFHCNHSSDSFIHSSALALSHTDFLAALSTIQEPSTYLQAKGCKEWEDAMCQEIEALEKNETWEVVPLPKGKKSIGCKWVYKVKVRADGSIDRYKARLVAKGYNQVEGLDYVDRFSPVAKAVTVCAFLAVATGFCWPIHQVDINNAFLHGFMEEDIYIKAPDGYHVQPGQSSYDHCLFTKQSIEGVIALIVYVDDVLITCSCEARIAEHKFIQDIIRDAGLEFARPACSPLPIGLKLSSHTSATLSDPEPFRRLVRRLLYMSLTRPDISFGAQQLSQFVHTPCQIHLDAALHLEATHHARRAEVRRAYDETIREILDVKVTEDTPIIQFEKAEHSGPKNSYNDALVISALLANYEVGRIFIDSGSSADILFGDAYDQMQLEDILLEKTYPQRFSSCNFHVSFENQIFYARRSWGSTRRPSPITKALYRNCAEKTKRSSNEAPKEAPSCRWGKDGEPEEDPETSKGTPPKVQLAEELLNIELVPKDTEKVTQIGS
ncbi:UNVERIFIED_CONTAM: Retrovirus-related Pol polyprotein from transposon RE1 [Sesamum latifolium]|uniref:Retrovirus-related Pol polyprotein from transposon RE1 n=1 Tax=Sesamum latifolium TaxID=2727402 RepID=A0AAW2TAC1_9LAMI